MVAGRATAVVSMAGMRALAVASVLSIALLSGCASTGGPVDGADGPARLDELATRLVGSFSSAEQAIEDPEFRDIRLEMVRIWPERDDGPWIYIEQAAAESLERPYRQRVYRLVASEDPARPAGTIESRVFELPGDPLLFAGAWREPLRFRTIEPKDLIPRDGCTVYLERGEDGSWFGGTDPESCPSSLRGARYATSEIDIVEDALRTWDRGFDAEGRQVWGAVKGPYVFRRPKG